MRIAFAAVVVLASSACDLCKQPDPPPCTAEGFGLGAAQAVNVEQYSPPSPCTLGPDDAEVTDEQGAQRVLRCPGNLPRPVSGIDFTLHKLVVVGVTSVGQAPAVQFSVRDDSGLHV